ncbi:M48 family metalloprotease, partial [bacterium]|nr:M48 family metalloprotease [bacterium]
MWEQISSNKMKSGFLVGFFIIFVVFLGWLFGRTTVWGPAAPILAAVIAGAAAWGSYYNSDRMVLAISRAKPAQKEDHPHLYHSVEGLAIAAGIPTPKLYIIDDTAPNAFATGRDPEHAAIAVTTGLLQKLNRVELEGVIG